MAISYIEVLKKNKTLSELLYYIKILWMNVKARVGLLIILFYALVGIIGPHFVPPPLVVNVQKSMVFLPPQLNNPYYWFGTGPLGQSTLAQLVYGTPSVLEVSFLAGLFATLIGMIVGIVSGFMKGIVDNILMGITDIVLTMPSIILILILATMIKTTNPFTLALILSITSWAGLARAIRSQVLSVSASPSIEVLKVLGVKRSYIIFNEIIPSLASYIAIHFIFNVEGAVYAEVGLFYLGVLPYQPNNWGEMIENAINSGALVGGRAVWYFLFPTITVTFYMIGLILLSYGIDEISNPRIRTY